MVYMQGYPAQYSEYIILPNNVESIIIDGNTLLINLRTGNLTASISESTLGNVTGNISVQQGGHKVIVKSEEGYVNITEA